MIIKGNVQGAGYRALVKLFARGLEIKGLVRNLDDGSVEVFADGSKQAIEKFLEKMDIKGKPEDPLSLHVDAIEVYWEGQPGYAEAWRSYSGFELDYGVEELTAVERETLESLEWSKLHFVGMRNVFREEIGGVKEELVGVRSGLAEFREEFRDYREEFRSCWGELREELGGVKGEVREMRGDIKDLHSEVRGMRTDMNESFQEMAKRYDAISSELVRTREELTRAVNGLLKLIEEFISERRGVERKKSRD